jgi:hypothetical protein
MNEFGSRYLVSFATPEDDAELRVLLRDNPVGTKISISYEREPSVMLASTVEGEAHRFLALRQRESSRIIGMGGCAFYDAWVNGEKTRIGYLSQLRVSAQARGTFSFLVKGYTRFTEMAAEAGVPFFVTTVIADNTLARRFLSSPKRGFPTYIERGRLHSLALPLWRVPSKAKNAWKGVVRRAVVDDKIKISEFLQREFRKFQFAPVFNEDVLWSEIRSRGLAVEDFLVAEDAGEIVGCLGLWDQSAFKQIVVRGYAPALRYGRGLVNALAPVLGTIRLPRVGDGFPHVYFSHVAAPDNKILCRLLAEGMKCARTNGYSYAALGLSETHPAFSTVRNLFNHLDYESVIYSVHHEMLGPEAKFSEEYFNHLEIARL